MGNLTILHVGWRKYVLAPDQVEFMPAGVKIRANADSPFTLMFPWHRVKKVTVVPRGD
jgi:hypothetical protein